MHQYRDAQKIPHVKRTTYIYPYADEFISSEHKERFPVIIDVFRRNLYESKKLFRLPPVKTEYKLKMCGTCIDDAKPSILICHPRSEPRMGLLVMKILAESHVREQYDSADMKVRFAIYLFLGPSSTTLGRFMEDFEIEMRNFSFTGAPVVSGEDSIIISTITCGIKVLGAAGPYFALTSAHAFEDERKAGRPHAQHLGGLDTNTYNLMYGSENKDANTFADVEYDIEGLMEWEGKTDWAWPPPPPGLRDIEYSHDGDSTGIKPARALGWREDCPNLDWVLLEIEKSEQWENLDLVSTIYEAPGLGNPNGRVLVLTCRGSLEGTICNLPTYIANSESNGHLCEVWSVTLKDPGISFL